MEMIKGREYDGGGGVVWHETKSEQVESEASQRVGGGSVDPIRYNPKTANTPRSKGRMAKAWRNGVFNSIRQVGSRGASTESERTSEFGGWRGGD